MKSEGSRQVDLASWAHSNSSFNLLKGVAIVFAPLLVFLTLLAGYFGGPESKHLSLRDWASAAPSDFLITTAKELAGMPGNGSSGPPYNQLRKGEQLGPLRLQDWGGTRSSNRSSSRFRD